MAAARKGRSRSAASSVGGRPRLRSVLRLASGLLACAAALTLLERFVWLGAVLAEWGFPLALLGVLLAGLCAAAREWAGLAGAFSATLLFAGPYSALYRDTRPTPTAGPTFKVAEAHLAQEAIASADVATWLGASAPDVAALTGLQTDFARTLPTKFVSYRVLTRGSDALFIKADAYSAHAREADGPLSAWLKVGKCEVRMVVIDLPELLDYATLRSRTQQIAQLTHIKNPARSIWFGHLGSRAEAADLRELWSEEELRDSRHSYGRLPTSPAAFPLLDRPLDHLLIHGWLSVRARTSDAGPGENAHKTLRATLELTEPRCHP